jgi:hypothetical protein
MTLWQQAAVLYSPPEAVWSAHTFHATDFSDAKKRDRAK